MNNVLNETNEYEKKGNNWTQLNLTSLTNKYNVGTVFVFIFIPVELSLVIQIVDRSESSRLFLTDTRKQTISMCLRKREWECEKKINNNNFNNINDKCHRNDIYFDNRKCRTRRDHILFSIVRSSVRSNSINVIESMTN